MTDTSLAGSPATDGGSGSNKRLKIVCLGLLFAVLALDLWTKDYMQGLLGLEPGRSQGANEVDVIPGFLAWQGTWNPGVTFGLAPNKTNLILGLTGIATLGLMIWFLGTRSRSRCLTIGLALILAGALGNLYDRWNWGQVRDFILLYVGELEDPNVVSVLGIRVLPWPNFNVADMGIVGGVILVLWDALFGYSAKRAKEAAAEAKAKKEQAEKPSAFGGEGAGAD